MINNITAMDAATITSAQSANNVEPPDGNRIEAFNRLLFAGPPQRDVGSLASEQMLVQQATTLAATVDVDLGAKFAGAVSQSVNKIVNMT